MKRSGIKRTTPLARATEPLRRSKPLGRGVGGAKRQRAIVGLSPEARRIAFMRSGGQCAVPGCTRTARDPHHCLPRQKWPEMADAPANVIAICRQCHDDHEHGNLRRRLPVAVLAPLADFPLDARQRAYLARTYR